MSNLGYFIAGFLLACALVIPITLFLLQQQKQKLAILAAELRSHSFDLKITLDELAEKNQILQQQSQIDSLSNAYNRSYFDLQMMAEIKRSRREQRPLALIFIDIDLFKTINDNYGHLVGDLVVKNIVSLIQQQLKRTGDKLCRYGGDEFAIILPNTELSGAVTLAESIRHTLNTTALIPQHTDLKISISAGCYAAIASSISCVKEYVGHADKALYLSKTHGRNQVYSQPLSKAVNL